MGDSRVSARCLPVCEQNDGPFRVTAKSDRMGYRLQGEALELTQPLEMISEAVSFGTIQVPPDGNPIVLLADRQTAGGYPRIAHIASADFSQVTM